MSDSTQLLCAQLFSVSQINKKPWTFTSNAEEGSCPGSFTSHLQNMVNLAFLLFFQSLTNLFPMSRKVDDSIGFFPTESGQAIS